jgi:UDP-N-acetylglucosamine transferase subunit ALG13
VTHAGTSHADAIVGHAGIGTLFAALERGKPIVVMPRRADLRETRNDHQIATARRFEALAGVVVAWDQNALMERLEALDRAKPTLSLKSESQGTLVRRIAEFIDGD